MEVGISLPTPRMGRTKASRKMLINQNNRIDELLFTVSALTKRVEKLEKAAGSSNKKTKPKEADKE